MRGPSKYFPAPQSQSSVKDNLSRLSSPQNKSHSFQLVYSHQIYTIEDIFLESMSFYKKFLHMNAMVFLIFTIPIILIKDLILKSISLKSIFKV